MVYSVGISIFEDFNESMDAIDDFVAKSLSSLNSDAQQTSI